MMSRVKVRNEGFVYVASLGYGNFYKIGRTKNMVARRKELSVANPRLRIVCCVWVGNSPDVEYLAHKKFKAHRHGREIFRFGESSLPKAINYIKSRSLNRELKRASKKADAKAKDKRDFASWVSKTVNDPDFKSALRNAL